MAAKHITEETFESTVKEGIVLLDWWAAWCGPCRRFAPIFEEAAGKYPDVVFGKIDTEAEPRLAATYDIRSIPTVMGFRDGILLFSQPGLLSAPQLDEVVTKLKALDMAEIHRKIAEEAAGTSA